MERFKEYVEAVWLFLQDFVKNLRLAFRGTARLFKEKLNVIFITMFMLVFIVYSFMFSLNDAYVNYRTNIKEYNSKQGIYNAVLMKGSEESIYQAGDVAKFLIEEINPYEISTALEEKKKIVFRYRENEQLELGEILLPKFLKDKYEVGDSFEFRMLEGSEELKVKGFSKDNKYVMALDTLANFSQIKEVELAVKLHEPMEKGDYYAMQEKVKNYSQVNSFTTHNTSIRFNEIQNQISGDLWTGMQWTIALVIVNLCIISYLLLKIYDKRYVSYKLCGAADIDVLIINSCQTLILTLIGFVLGLALFYSSFSIFADLGIKQFFTIEKLMSLKQVKPILSIFLFYTGMLLGTNVLFTWIFLRRNRSLRGGR